MFEVAKTICFWIVMAELFFGLLFAFACFFVERGARREAELDEEAVKEMESQ